MRTTAIHGTTPPFTFFHTHALLGVAPLVTKEYMDLDRLVIGGGAFFFYIRSLILCLPFFSCTAIHPYHFLSYSYVGNVVPENGTVGFGKQMLLNMASCRGTVKDLTVCKETRGRTGERERERERERESDSDFILFSFFTSMHVYFCICSSISLLFLSVSLPPSIFHAYNLSCIHLSISYPLPSCLQ